ncbi:MAG: beta-ribofuranosylaminobenzene 5'-phosphate synthase family protein [Mariniblastus sp.]
MSIERLRVLEQVTISAPSRLHFGLFSIGNVVDRMYGGVGLMIDSPRTKVTCYASGSFSLSGPNAKACRHAIETWFKNQTGSNTFAFRSLDELPVELKIESVPPRHSGFGTGTQLALCSAMAITQLLELPLPGPLEMAASVARGARSGIGSHGFYHGGFLVDRGKETELVQGGEKAPLAPLDFQTGFPKQWPVVTLILKNETGLSGGLEMDAFANLPPTSESERESMIEIVRTKMIPGVTQTDYDLFADGVFEFGRRSGMMYEPIQNGPYNGHSIEKLVNEIRSFGVPAVGQSSWGPCVFAITRDDETANKLVSFVRANYSDQCDVEITRADNQGAELLSANKA